MYKHFFTGNSQIEEILGLERRRAATIAASLALLIALFFAVANLSWTDIAVHLLAILSAVALVLFLLLFRATPRIDSVALGPPVPLSPGESEVDYAIGHVAREYDAAAIDYFVNTLLALPVFLSRVEEDVEIKGRKLFVRTFLQYRYSRPSPQHGAQSSGTSPARTADDASAQNAPPGSRTLLVRLVTARKGLLFDQFMPRTSHGALLSVLPQWEARGLVAVSVRSLFYLALAESKTSSTRMDVSQVALSPDDQKIMNDVIVDAVCQVGGARKEARQTPHAGSREDVLMLRREEALGRINELSAAFDSYWKQKIQTICRVLARCYLIIAEVPEPDGGHLVVQYSSLYSPERMHVSQYERLRAKYGLDPSTIDVPMTRALHADSYHFEMVAPAGQYIFSHHLEGLGSRQPLRQKAMVIGDAQQYVRVYHEDGRSIAHLYVRRQGDRFNLSRIKPDSMQPPDFKSVIHLREIPPGALGGAALLAVLSALVISFFTFTRVGMNEGGTPGEIPALILALPAFVSSVIGRSLDTHRVGGTSLTAYFGLLIVAILSVFSTLLYLLDAGRSMPTERYISIVGGIVLHTDILEESYWGRDRLVVRRPEVPDSDITDMIAASDRVQRMVLSAAVQRVIEEVKQDDHQRLSHELREPPWYVGSGPPASPADG